MTGDPTAPPSLTAMQALARDGEFEASLSGLETVVEHLERGGLSIDDSIAWYEVGLALTRRCSDLLRQAELRIGTVEDRYAALPGIEDADDDEP